MAKINGGKSPTILKRLNIDVTPTILLFSKSNKSGSLKFHGSRSRDRIVKFVLSHGIIEDDDAVEGYCQLNI